MILRNHFIKFIKKFYVVLAATLLVLFVGGCFAPKGGSPLEDLNATGADKLASYAVKAGDTLKIDVWGEPKLSGEVLVREDGKFTMHLINDVLATGLTSEQIGREVSEKLSIFVPSAYVSVSVVKSAPVRYFLVGKFVKPGRYTSEGKISLLQTIATGGGFAPFANESYITLIRKTSHGEIRYHLDYNRVIDSLEPNPEIREGDTIVVR